MLHSELMESMSAREFLEWRILEEIEPFGERAAELRAGLICSVIANANRDPKKRRQPFTPNDFTISLLPREQTPAPATLSDAERLHEQFLLFKQGYEEHQRRKGLVN